MSSSDNQVIRVYNYKTSLFEEFPYYPNLTCEEICILCCKKFEILPTARLLFGLRVSASRKWIISCQNLKSTVQYEFRMRFKVPDLDSLHKIDPNAYDYLYAQIRYDLVNDNISDIRYPANKDKVVGLGATDMSIDYMQHQIPEDVLVKNYKHYMPKQLVKTHRFFAKKKIREGFQTINKNNYELSYVKRSYLHSITALAPNYLMEEYSAIAEKVPDEDGSEECHAVTINVDPFDPEGPTVKVKTKFKKDWIVITKLENIYALYREGKKFVRLDISGSPRGFRLEFARPFELKSFMTYVSGYFRLMIKWMCDPCVQFITPSLQDLKNLRCHGPVGADFSYSKIRDKSGKCGSYIVRQCEREYDVYYIDINTKGIQTETFKILRNGNQWQLEDNERLFHDLTELALAIPTASDNKFRISPTEYDKSPLLLICLPKNLLTKNVSNELTEAQLQSRRVQIFDLKEDLQWYKNSERECEDGKLICLLADWIQPKNVKDVRVTLKVLKSEMECGEFIKLANIWSRIYSPEFIKLYGITLSPPYMMVMENARFGPLNEFLYTQSDKVPTECLLDAIHGLVCAIAYMQEKGFFHGYIRCSNLLVTKYDSRKQLLIAKIADPGLSASYKLHDLPWIPLEYHKNLNGAKQDPLTDIWAFATTVWEIFARGKPLHNLTPEILYQNYNRYGGILPKPVDCPEELYQVMMDGWSIDPDKRFNQLSILKLLNSIKEGLAGNYSTIDITESVSDMSSIMSDFSNTTEDTFQTLLNGNSSSSTFSGNSTVCERGPLLRTHNGFSQFHSNLFENTTSVLAIPNGKIIYKEKIGEGHYGTVHRGVIHYHNNSNPVQVAIKTLKCKRFSQDFLREVKIMQALDHPNIVKIKMYVEAPHISIIMEYVECGSFIVYLSSMKSNLTDHKLLQFALDIAKGMEYLRSKKVIHRDLAARNILVDRERVKISDFGLAQLANHDGYYFAQSEREIPIRWYAPESIKTTKFSFQSDVWSYGVTLFEMFSRGEMPNLDPSTDLSQVEFLNRLERGERLRRPELCPDYIYDKLMMPCWHENPKMRPDFRKIVEIINCIRNESGERIRNLNDPNDLHSQKPELSKIF